MIYASEQIASARMKLGLTQGQLAERVGLTQAAISQYEAGTRQPSVETLAALLAALGLRMQVIPAKRRKLV